VVTIETFDEELDVVERPFELIDRAFKRLLLIRGVVALPESRPQRRTCVLYRRRAQHNTRANAPIHAGLDADRYRARCEQ
jgi:hypothetical protein